MAFVAIACVLSPQPWVTAQGEKVAAMERELIRDPQFRRGFRLLAPKTGKRVVCDTLQWDHGAGEPVWDMAQWSSKHSLQGAKPERLPSGAVRYANEAKAVVVGPAGSEEADLILRVNGGVEYGDRPRQKGEEWPHLLVSQPLEGHPRLTDLQALPFEISVRLNHCQKHDMPGYTRNLHAAHYQMFVTVQNRNRQSKGYGDFYWFGVPLYDDRHRLPRSFMAPDVGLSKFIYTPAGETFTEESAHDGEWVTVKRDLLPLMLQGLDEAWKRGHLKDSRDLADYRLGGMNLGWEVPGTFDVEVQVRGLSLKAVSE